MSESTSFTFLLPFVNIAMKTQVIFICVLTKVIFIFAEEEKEMVMKFLSAKCQSFDPAWVKITLCRVKPYSRNLSALNLVVELTKDLSEPMDVTIDIFRKDVTRFSQFWPTVRYEYCSGRRNGFGKFATFILDAFRKSVPQMFQLCPYNAGIHAWRNITMDNNRKYPLSQWIASNVFRLKLKVFQFKNVEKFLIDLQIDAKSELDWSRWGANGH